MEKMKEFLGARRSLLVHALFLSALLLLNVPSANAQTNTVTGTVEDTFGAVIGASVVEKDNTGNGTITDINGQFSLQVGENSTLVVSFVGYQTQEIALNGQKTIKVTLKEDTEMLEEVVVVGFATQKKMNLTGSVGTASAKDLEARPVSNAVQALQGVIPGLNISTSGVGGELNATKSIDVRGTGTVGKDAAGNAFSSGSPLILIDGMEGDLNSINPQDIENISVLKDAAASSIYGSRAPFGVVLVTTKSGKQGRPQINYNMNYRINTPVKMPKMANAFEFVTYFDDAEFNGSGNHLFTEEYRNAVKEAMTTKPESLFWGSNGSKFNYDYPLGNVDWLKEYYKSSSPSMEHNVSVSGGNEKVTYYLSANYMQQDGFMRYGTEDYNRYTVTGKISAQLTNDLKVDYSSRWVRTDYTRPTYMTEDFYNHILRRARPNRVVADDNGYLMNDINYIGAMRDGGRHKEQKDALSQQIRITLTPLKDWNIIGEFNVKTDNDWTHWEQLVVYSHYKDNPDNTYIALTSANKDQVSEYSYKATYLNPTLYSNYKLNIERHNLAAMVGFQAEQMNYRDITGARTGLTSTDLPVLNQTTDADSYTLKGQYQSWRNAGFFGRINYDFDGKYLVEANLRYDGSSRFRRASRWVWTPSFSLGWNVARENFWEHLQNYVESLKVRISYGELANQNTTNWYPTYQTIGVTTNGGTWLQGGTLTNVAAVPGLISTTLTWEKIKNTNLGLDFGAFNNRLTGSFDYFWRKTQNMVGPGIELPATLGTDVPITNNTDLTTYGWELSLGWRDQIGKEFKYGVRLSISDSQTRIDRYPNPTNSLDKYLEGELIGNIYGYTTIGIAKTQAEMDNHLASLPNGGQTALGDKWEAGDIMYADLNGDGKISNGANTMDDMGDLKKIGNDTPRFRTGISLDASWKGIDFSMFWQGVLKRDFDPGEGSMVFWGASGGQWWSTSFAEHIDYFRPENTSSALGANLNAYYPRALFSAKNHQPQTRYLQNAAYMRLKNLQIGYTLPKQWISKIGLQNVRFYVSGENLLTITSLTNTMDPETAGIGMQGGTVYPLSRTYSFGLSVNF